MNNNSGGNRFFDGFLWGAIVGGGVVFLLGTKKGKKLLKTISEEGAEGLSNLLEEQIEQEEDYEEGQKEVLPGNGVSANSSVHENIEKQEEPQTIRKRFFRRK